MWWQAEGEGGVQGEESKMGRRRRWRSLGGSWWRGRQFKLSTFAAFNEFSVQNHFPGDAGHLTIGHCVGSVPATQRTVSSTKPKQGSSSAYMWLCSDFATLTFDFQIHSARRPGSVSQRKMTSTSGQNLAWEVLRRTKYIYKGTFWYRETLLFHLVSFLTWVVWNDLSCVLRTATRAVTGVGPEAPWSKDMVHLLLMTNSRKA